VQGGRLMDVRFRLFDDGVGFRYEIPAQPAFTTMRIADELTEFAIAPQGTAWWVTGLEWNREEQLYNRTPIDAVSTAQTPMTVRLQDGRGIIGPALFSILVLMAIVTTLLASPLHRLSSRAEAVPATA